jgi:glycine betaine/choline ABC-type transport system substrate-binding protein
MPTLINAVSARLTTGSLRSLNAQAVLDGRRPRSAAEAWLRAQGLM